MGFTIKGRAPTVFGHIVTTTTIKTKTIIRITTVVIIVTTIMVIIISITQFSIVIGSPRAYLSRNRRAITWVSNYMYSI